MIGGLGVQSSAGGFVSSVGCIPLHTGERVQKGIAHWDKQNYAVPAPNCMLKI